jgi:hypothetical protein
MDEIKLPQHIVNRIERRWTARFAQMPGVRQPLVSITTSSRCPGSIMSISTFI